MRIRTKLMVTFTGFTILALLILMLFQGVLLDGIYHQMKIIGMKSAVQDMKVSVERKETKATLEYWRAADDVDVYVFDQNASLQYSNVSMDPVGIPFLSESDMKTAYKEAVEGEGSYFAKREAEFHRIETRGTKPFKKHPEEKEDDEFRTTKPFEPKVKREGHIVLYGETVTDPATDQTLMVLAVSDITPMDATVRTLSVQFVAASLVVIAMAIVLSVVVAKNIASPIVAINRSAKGLSDGTYRSPIDKAKYLEAVQLQETLDQAALDLKKTRDLQRELIANVSHDLRTPLTMITGYSEAIRDFPEDYHADSIQVIIDEANRLNALVNDLLDLSKLKSGVQVLHKAPVELTKMLKDIVQRFECMVENKGYRIVLEYDADVTVEADAVRLSQAVYNLIDNALYHSGADRTVTVRQSVGEKTVRLMVIDHGPGIAKDQLEFIWDRYYQVRRGDEEAIYTSHSGLGLSIVKSVAELHGGCCGAESEEGKGSTFWIEIPKA